jgi:acetyl esterase/lipase
VRCPLLVAFALLALLAAPSCAAPEEKRDVVYDARFGADTSMDVYLPDGDDTKRPGVLFIHGGSWSGGSKSHFEYTGRRLARAGYVAASIDYRLIPKGFFPNNVKDCICALAFLRAHAEEYQLDPERIVVMGYSAGAHLASLVGLAADHPELTPDCEAAGGRPVALPRGVISASGPQDWRIFWDQSSELAEDVVGGPPDALPHVYDLASPRWHVKPGGPSFLLMQDAFDIGGIQEMRQSLLAAGTDTRLLKVAGSLHILEQHGDPGSVEVGAATETPEAYIAMDGFLRRTVGRP